MVQSLKLDRTGWNPNWTEKQYHLIDPFFWSVGLLWKIIQCFCGTVTWCSKLFFYPSVRFLGVRMKISISFQFCNLGVDDISLTEREKRSDGVRLSLPDLWSEKNNKKKAE